MTAAFAQRAFGVAEATAFVKPRGVDAHAEITVSLGTGENPSKRIADPFERRLLELLSAGGRSVMPISEGWQHFSEGILVKDSVTTPLDTALCGLLQF